MGQRNNEILKRINFYWFFQAEHTQRRRRLLLDQRRSLPRRLHQRKATRIRLHKIRKRRQLQRLIQKRQKERLRLIILLKQPLLLRMLLERLKTRLGHPLQQPAPPLLGLLAQQRPNRLQKGFNRNNCRVVEHVREGQRAKAEDKQNRKQCEHDPEQIHDEEAKPPKEPQQIEITHRIRLAETLSQSLQLLAASS